MAEKLFDDSIFGDIAPPELAAKALQELYGVGAYDAADQCAGAALTDGRYRDYRFWSDCRQIIGDADADDMLTHLPSADELLRLVRQFARIGDRNTRDFAIDRMEDIAEGRLVPMRPTRSG